MFNWPRLQDMQSSENEFHKLFPVLTLGRISRTSVDVVPERRLRDIRGYWRLVELQIDLTHDKRE